tara:strand:+ start:617 stop:847 length:231 start_codon:yes stop_codon:yes gene_type:complete
MAQKLSPKASAAKKARDLAAAKSPLRKKRKAENQVERRKHSPFSLRGKDVHHGKNGKLTLISTSSNRDVWKRKERT